MKIDIPSQKVQFDLVAMFNGQEHARMDNIFETDLPLRFEQAEDGAIAVTMDEVAWGRETVAKLREYADELEKDVEGLEKKEDGS